MSRKIACTLTIVGVIAAIWIVWWVRTSSERSILRAYARLDSAMSRKDLPEYMSMLTPDYTETRLNQRPRDRGQAEAVYRQILLDWTDFRSEPVEVDAFEEGQGTAKATVKRFSLGEMVDRAGAFGPKGTKHRMRVVISSIDRWRDSQAGWMLQRRVIALAMIYVDGKLLPGGTIHDDD